MLQQQLLQEVKAKRSESNLFEDDKKIEESFESLLKDKDKVAKLPNIEKQRKRLRVRIKNAFL